MSLRRRGCELRGRRCRLISPARRAHSSNPPHAAADRGRWMGQTGGETDGDRTVTWTLPHTMRAVSITQSYQSTFEYVTTSLCWFCIKHRSGFRRQSIGPDYFRHRHFRRRSWPEPGVPRAAADLLEERRKLQACHLLDLRIWHSGT